MHIPIAQKTPAEFTQQIADALGKADSHLYIDTSFLMWLTMKGPETRTQFRDWAQEYNGRIHVPLWTKHEYYRHHAGGTLRSRLNRKSDELAAALKAFRLEIARFSDNAFLPGQPEGALEDALDDVGIRVREVTSVAKSWGYQEAANDIIGWMNDRTMETATPFQSMVTLASVGASRFSHDIPPGFLDRIKKDRPKRGSNRYGDLLFWQEVVEHAKLKSAGTVVVITRDRKHDWFLKTTAPEVEGDWKRLREKWEPVPHPHPTLAFEMKVSGKAELMLLDELYLGAYLWKHRRPAFARLAATAIDVDPEKFTSAERKGRLAAERALKRPEPASVGMVRALDMMKKAVVEPDADVLAVLGKLETDAPEVEKFVRDLGPATFVALNLDQLACCCRALHERAAAEPGPARSAVVNMLDRLDQFPTDKAAAVYVGLLMSIYFDGAAPRTRPRSPVLQDLFDWQQDTAVQLVLKAFSIRLKQVKSAVLYAPAASAPDAKVLITSNTEQHQTPVLLDQVYFDNKALLTDGTLQPDMLLRTAVGGSEASLKQVAAAVSQHFGLPAEQVVIEGGDAEDLRSIPELFGFREFDRFGSDEVPEEEFPPPEDEEDDLPETEDDDYEHDEEDDDE